MVFLPLKDDNPLKVISFQYATVLLMTINLLVYIWQDSLGEVELVRVAMSAGVIPLSLLGDARIPAEYAMLPPEVTLLTYMFLHGDWWHLAGNMLFLWVFGDNVEDAMGFFRFILFYLLCGVIAGLAHALANPDSEGPLIGASGAIGGVVAAYVMLYPRVRMWTLAFARIPLKIPAYLMIGAWFGFQIFSVLALDGGDTAWWAHIGGFVAGLGLVILFKRSDQQLFGGAPAD
jgi:membrane associated rhomboid family serine protease